MENKELYEKYKDLDQNDLDVEFSNACHDGNLKFVKYLLTSSDLKKHADIHGNEDYGFKWACENEYIEIIKYLVASPELKGLTHTNNDYGLVCACSNGNLELVKYLLTSPELKKHADIHACNDEGFRSACEEGNLNIVKYLLTSPDLKEHADIHAWDDEGFKNACIKGKLDIVEYLLTSSDLKEHADIHAINHNGSDGFKLAFTFKNLEIINFFIFDLNIGKSNSIAELLREYPNEQVDNMFNTRELNQRLKRDLKSDNVNTKKSKL